MQTRQTSGYARVLADTIGITMLTSIPPNNFRKKSVQRRSLVYALTVKLH